MHAIQIDRRAEVFHNDELPIAHVTAIDLQQEALFILTCLKPYTVIEDASVARMRGVPGHIFALRFRELSIVGRQIAVSIHGRAEDDIVF